MVWYLGPIIKAGAVAIGKAVAAATVHQTAVHAAGAAGTAIAPHVPTAHATLMAAAPLAVTPATAHGGVGVHGVVAAHVPATAAAKEHAFAASVAHGAEQHLVSHAPFTLANLDQELSAHRNSWE
jgi:hypothetical protein